MSEVRINNEFTKSSANKCILQKEVNHDNNNEIDLKKPIPIPRKDSPTLDANFQTELIYIITIDNI